MPKLEVKHLRIEDVPDSYIEGFRNLQGELMGEIFKWAKENKVFQENLPSLIAMCAMDCMAWLVLTAEMDIEEGKFLEYVKMLLDSAEGNSISFLRRNRKLFSFTGRTNKEKIEE